MPIKPRQVEHTFMARIGDKWQPIKEISAEDFYSVEEYYLLQTEPIPLSDTEWRYEIKLDGCAYYFEWFLWWTYQRYVPKISRK